jgi:hypothetical protein
MYHIIFKYILSEFAFLYDADVAYADTVQFISSHQFYTELLRQKLLL